MRALLARTPLARIFPELRKPLPGNVENPARKDTVATEVKYRVSTVDVAWEQSDV